MIINEHYEGTRLIKYYCKTTVECTAGEVKILHCNHLLSLRLVRNYWLVDFKVVPLAYSMDFYSLMSCDMIDL